MLSTVASLVVHLTLARGAAEGALPPVLVHASEVREQPSPDGGYGMRMLFTPEQTADEPTWLGLATFEIGGGTPEHRHSHATEVLFVVKGEGLLILRGQEYRIRAGDALRIPADAPHSFCNDGEQLLELLQTFVPPKRRRLKAPSPGGATVGTAPQAPESTQSK